jgi:2-methylcitrate dehydratase PrpD
MTAIEQLGSLVAHSGREPLSDAVRELATLHLIDGVGAWIAGAKTTEGLSLLRLRVAMLNGTTASLGVDLATRCALARLSEIDDIHLPSMTTPGGIVIPSALSMARAMRAPSADEVIAAILAGYEVMTRLGRALGGPTILYRGIWPTYFAAPAAVAAVFARLFQLDPRDAANALALALTFAAPGVGHHNAATTSRWLAIGNAARNGFSAALAAQQGFTGDLNLFEGNFFSDIYGITPDIAALTERVSEHTALNEVSFKPWCAARQTMAATQALREIIDSGVAPESITEVHASVLPPHLKMIDHGVVAGDRASHLTSLPYCMAIAAMAPELAFDVQSSPPDLPPAVRAFMTRIKVDADEGLLTDYPRTWPARVRIVAGSAVHERLVSHVPGDPVWAFGRAHAEAKFLRFVLPVFGTGLTEYLLEHCGGMLTTGHFGLFVESLEAAFAHRLLGYELVDGSANGSARGDAR